MDLQRTEQAAELDLLLRRNTLIAEDQQMMIEMRTVDSLEVMPGERHGQIEIEDLRSQRTMQGTDSEILIRRSIESRFCDGEGGG